MTANPYIWVSETQFFSGAWRVQDPSPAILVIPSPMEQGRPGIGGIGIYIV